MSYGDPADRPVDDGHCFACGQHSEIGMHLRFHPDGEHYAVRAQTVIDEKYQGWKGMTHGGIIATMIDDAMAHAGAAAGFAGFTAAIDVRFRKPVPTGEVAIVRAWVTWQRRNVLGVSSRVTDGNGTVLASAEGSFVGKAPLAPGERLGLPDG
ncbi:MAG TPA: PaaI family thioesterase [Candidatus Baltobacteraceae bacterium]